MAEAKEAQRNGAAGGDERKLLELRRLAAMRSALSGGRLHQPALRRDAAGRAQALPGIRRQ